MITFFIISAVCAAIFWPAGTFLLWQIPFCKKRGTTGELPTCSVIIPARNEESNIVNLLRSLNNQTTLPGEVLVVNDQSTDNTAIVAEENGATVISITDKPAGWTGKTWACWQGAQAAQYDPMVFVDADTQFNRAGLENMIQCYAEHDGMVTVQPYHTMKKAYEKLSAFFNIMIMAGMGAFTLLGKRLKPSGSFGPCMICSKKDYFETGGHKAARSTVLENLSLGKIFIDAGKSINCFGGKHSISFQMYPFGMGDLVEGWTKGFATGASNTRPLFLVMTILWITGCFITFSGLCLSPFLDGTAMSLTAVYALLYILYVMQVFWMLFRIGNFGFISALLFPVHAFFFVYIFIKSYISIFIIKKVRWRGRSVEV